MPEKILITGGAGYLGSILCEHLLAAGHEVTVLDTLLFAQTPLFHFCADPKFDFIFGDCRDESVLAKLVAKADVIIPLAAIVGAPACDRDPLATRSINLDAIRRLN
ncbi:MAG: NAD(P)-dependent oxidoreductase, partial [Verrucomicrobiota bacterium]